ncbi:MAG: hypothetical protein E7327_05235 [Clostridiales bacterium]|nr:hypothetical protein [Clostridiales bacterium]
METIIIEITLGNTGDVAEFMLPAHVPIRSLTQDIAQLVEQVNLSVAFDRESIVLFDLDRSILLQQDWTLAQNGVRDSSRLMIL